MEKGGDRGKDLSCSRKERLLLGSRGVPDNIRVPVKKKSFETGQTKKKWNHDRTVQKTFPGWEGGREKAKRRV